MFPSRAELLSLGSKQPRETRARIPKRDDRVSLDELPRDDAERLRRIYRALVSLRDGLHGRDRPGLAMDATALSFIDRSAPILLTEASALDAPPSRAPKLRAAYHDLRGGSLQALVMHLALVRSGSGSVEDLARVFLLARDHIKIMRNVLPDLDPEGYQADLEERNHSVQLLRDKWSGVDYRLRQGQVTVELDCDFEGTIATCCMEFSTFDRVVYNLVNNAAEHAADGRVRLSILPLNESSSTLVRIAVSNQVTPTQHRRLLDRFGDDLRAIFAGDFSTSGEGRGLGLRISGELVTYGLSLPSTEEATKQGYLGADLLHGAFVAWFGWPCTR